MTDSRLAWGLYIVSGLVISAAFWSRSGWEWALIFGVAYLFLGALFNRGDR